MSLILHLPLDRDTLDYSGNNRPTINYGATQKGRGYEFNGVNNTIRFGTGADYFPLPEFSISIWFKSYGLTPVTGILPGILSMTYGILIYIYSTHITFVLDNGTTLIFLSSTSGYDFYNDNKWHNVILTASSNLMEIYIDGKFNISRQTTWPGTTRWPTMEFLLGRDVNVSSARNYTGLLKDFRLYDHVLTENEIQQLCNPPATVKIQSAHRGPHLVNEGLAFGMDADDRSRFYKGEPTTNTFPRTPDTLAFARAYNGSSYGFGSATNLQQVIDNTLRFDNRSSVTKVSRINSGVKQIDCVLISTLNPANKTTTLSFWYYGTYGTTIQPYNNDGRSLIYYLDDNGNWQGGNTSQSVPVPIRQWKQIILKIVNTAGVDSNSPSWMILHSNFSSATLDNTEFWAFTMFQLEQNDHPTQFTTSARNSQESIFDLSKSVTCIDVGNTKFDSSAHPIYINPSATYVSGFKDTGVPAPTSITIESVFMPDPLGSSWRCALHKGDDTSIGSTEFWLGINSNLNKITATIGARTPTVNYDAGMTNISAVANKYYHVLATWNGSNVYVYVNGNLEKTYALSTYTISQYSRIVIGSSFVEGGTYQFLGKIPIVRVYWDKSFTEQEVKQNFNAYKTRFQIV